MATKQRRTHEKYMELIVLPYSVWKMCLIMIGCALVGSLIGCVIVMYLFFYTPIGCMI